MADLRFGKLVFIVAVFWVATAVASPAQTFTRLTKFNGTDGAWPLYESLLQGTDGNFYGTTSFGGAHSAGTVFEITPHGRVTTLYSFCSQSSCADGSVPYAGLVQGSNGNFYGTTFEGGNNDDGTLFELTPTGQLTTLHTFCSQPDCTDGLAPDTGLIEATNGNFYGVTSQSVYGAVGTIFELTPSGKLTTLYSTSIQGDGPTRGLVEASDGNFYGVTAGGSYKKGSIFEITAEGRFTELYSFCSETNCPDGEFPNQMIQAADGNLYGTTSYGGAYNSGAVFRLTEAGQFTLLYSFCSATNCTDGATPYAPVVQGTDGNFYGTTLGGGASGYGTIFEITSGGTLTTLYSFCSETNCADGEFPYAPLVQGTDGSFYGTTYGGANCPGRCGTVYRLSVGLGRFVEARPYFSKVGQAVDILGNNLRGTTSVSFNGTPARFAVVSSTFIRAVVPAGATPGMISVTTPSGTLSSNAAFKVER